MISAAPSSIQHRQLRRVRTVRIGLSGRNQTPARCRRRSAVTTRGRLAQTVASVAGHHYRVAMAAVRTGLNVRLGFEICHRRTWPGYHRSPHANRNGRPRAAGLPSRHAQGRREDRSARAGSEREKAPRCLFPQLRRSDVWSRARRPLRPKLSPPRCIGCSTRPVWRSWCRLGSPALLRPAVRFKRADRRGRPQGRGGDRCAHPSQRRRSMAGLRRIPSPCSQRLKSMAAGRVKMLGYRGVLA